MRAESELPACLSPSPTLPLRPRPARPVACANCPSPPYATPASTVLPRFEDLDLDLDPGLDLDLDLDLNPN